MRTDPWYEISITDGRSDRRRLDAIIRDSQAMPIWPRPDCLAIIPNALLALGCIMTGNGALTEDELVALARAEPS